MIEPGRLVRAAAVVVLLGAPSFLSAQMNAPLRSPGTLPSPGRSQPSQRAVPPPQEKKPVISRISAAGGCLKKGSAVDVEGRDFGSREGTVELTGFGDTFTLQVRTWSEGKITALLQNRVREGVRYGVTVRTAAGGSNTEPVGSCAAPEQAVKVAPAPPKGRGQKVITTPQPPAKGPGRPVTAPAPGKAIPPKKALSPKEKKDPVISTITAVGGCLRQGGTVEIEGHDFGKLIGTVDLATFGKKISLLVRNWSERKVIADLRDPIVEGRRYSVLVSTAGGGSDSGAVGACGAAKEPETASPFPREPASFNPSGFGKAPQKAGGAKGPLLTEQRSGLTPQKAQRLSTSLALEVREFSNDFEKWSSSRTITEPQTLTFRWSTDAAAATATWKVLTTEVKESVQMRPKVLSSGPLSPVASTPTTFQIPFSGFIPQWPPVSPGVYRYWVAVSLADARGEPVHVIKGSSVKISYRAPGETTVFTNICENDAGCPSGHFCRDSDRSCQPREYSCGQEVRHLILGTDGSSANCSPYVCYTDGSIGLPLCMSSCGSTSDCAPNYVCDAHGRCMGEVCDPLKQDCPPGFLCSAEKGEEARCIQVQ